MNNTYINVENVKAYNFLTSEGYKFVKGVKEHFAGYSPNEKPCAISKVWFCTNAFVSGNKWNRILRKNNLLL